MNLENIIEEQFFITMKNSGITPRENLSLVMDGNIHRFSVEGDRYCEKSGAYYIHADGWPNWAIMDYRQHSSMIKFTLDKEFMKETQFSTWPKKDKKKELEEEKRKREEARKRAYDEWKSSSREGIYQHPYIQLKKIRCLGKFVKVHGRRKTNDYCSEGDLLIPLINPVTGRFQSLQRISYKTYDGKHIKGIYPSTIFKGAMYPFYIPRFSEIVICEGFATGSSIFEATKGQSLVICAMSCNNMAEITKIFHEKYNNIPIIIGADNDEAGLRVADEIIKNGHAQRIITPPIKGYDWNDYLTR